MRPSVVPLAALVTSLACAEALGPNDGAYRLQLVAASAPSLGWGPDWEGPLIACVFPLELRASGRNSSVSWHGAIVTYFAGATRSTALDTVHLTDTQVISAWRLPTLQSGERHPFSIELRSRIPFEASIEVRYSAASQEKRARLRVACGPKPPASYTPPTVLAPTVSGPPSLRAGDSIKVFVRASSTYGLMRTQVSLSGSFERTDSWLHFSGRSASDSITYYVPPDAIPDVPITLTVTAFDAAGETRSTTTIIEQRVVDVAPPTLHTARVSGGIDGWISTDDWMRFEITASDDLDLSRAIVIVETEANVSIRDTVPFATLFAVRVRDSWEGIRSMRVRVVDQTGKSSNVLDVPSAGYRFYPKVTRPLLTIPLPGSESEPVFDRARNWLYFVDGTNVGRLDLTSMTRLSAIPLPIEDGEAVHGEGDLSVTGDSLILTLPLASALLIVDLRAPTPVVSRVNLRVPPRSGGEPIPVSPKDVKVAGDGRVFVLASEKNADGDQLLLASLATGTGEWMDIGPIDGRFVYLARDPARSRVLLLRLGCPRALVVATNTLQPCGATLFLDLLATSRPHFSPAGDKLLTGVTQTDLDLRELPYPAVIQEPYFATMAYSADDSMFWVLEEYRLSRIRRADGARLDWMEIPSGASTIHVQADGSALYILSVWRTAVTRVLLSP